MTFYIISESLKKSFECLENHPSIADDFQVYYAVIKRSKYSQELSVAMMRRSGIYEIHCDDPEINNPVPVDNFDSVNFGYPISFIESHGKILIYIDHTDEVKKITIFPGRPLPAHTAHTILLGPKVLNGRSDGVNGIGIIPTCSQVYNPHFTWYKNVIKQKSGSFLYWINMGSGEVDAWDCIITCDGC